MSERINSVLNSRVLTAQQKRDALRRQQAQNQDALRKNMKLAGIVSVLAALAFGYSLIP